MPAHLPDVGSVEFATINGLHVRYARSGPKEGFPVLLTSPWPESLYAFRDLLTTVNHEHPTIALDLPGFGHSESEERRVVSGKDGSLSHRLGCTLGRHPHACVGPDVGTSALLFAASKQPNLFESLVVGGGAANADLATGQLKEIIATPAGAFSHIDGGAVGLGFVTQASLRDVPAAVLEDYRLASAGRRFEDAANYVRSYPHDLPRLEPMLAKIETPVLVIVGRNDPIVPPENGKFIAARLPRNRYVELDGGHLIWEDASEDYADESRNGSMEITAPSERYTWRRPRATSPG